MFGKILYRDSLMAIGAGEFGQPMVQKAKGIPVQREIGRFLLTQVRVAVVQLAEVKIQ